MTDTTDRRDDSDSINLDDLDAFEGFELPDTDEEREGYVVTDDETLWRIIRRLRAVERKRARLSDLVQADMDRLARYAAAKDAPLARDAAYLRKYAEDYVLAARAKNPNVKRMDTPFGTVQTRKATGKWEIADSVALIEWAAKTRPNLLKSDPKFVLADAKLVLKAEDDGTVVDPFTAEVVPGLKAMPAGVTASVTLVQDDATGEGDR